MLILDNGDKLRGDASATAVIDYTIHGLDGNTLKQLADGQLADSTGDIYTASAIVVVKAIIFVNTDSLVRTINLFLLPSGGTERRLLAKDFTLGVGYSLHYDGAKVSLLSPAGAVVSSYVTHATSHTDGSDDIQDATAGQKGLATDTQIIKLDSCETNSKDDQTGSEIKTLYEAEADTNAYTDTEKTKLAGVATGATKYPDTGEQAFLDADHTKLDGIEAGADVTDAVNIASSIHGVAGKTTPVDADEVGLIDSAVSNVLKVLTWANIKATLKTYFDTLYGSLSNLVEDTTPQLGGTLELNEKTILVDATLTSDHTWTGPTQSVTAGEELTIGEVAYLKSDGKYWLIDADAEATADTKLVMATATIAADATGIVLLPSEMSFIRDDSTDEWTVTAAGDVMFLSVIAGELTNDVSGYTTGDIVRICGYMETTTILNFNVDKTFIEIA